MPTEITPAQQAAWDNYEAALIEHRARHATPPPTPEIEPDCGGARYRTGGCDCASCSTLGDREYDARGDH